MLTEIAGRISFLLCPLSVFDRYQLLLLSVAIAKALLFQTMFFVKLMQIKGKTR